MGGLTPKNPSIIVSPPVPWNTDRANSLIQCEGKWYDPEDPDGEIRKMTENDEILARELEREERAAQQHLMQERGVTFEHLSDNDQPTEVDQDSCIQDVSGGGFTFMQKFNVLRNLRGP